MITLNKMFRKFEKGFGTELKPLPLQRSLVTHCVWAATAVVLASTAVHAGTPTLTWGNASQYSSAGYAPRVSGYGFARSIFPASFLDVHQAGQGSGPMDFDISSYWWNNEGQYDTGSAPSIGANGNNTFWLELHQCGGLTGQLCGDLGTAGQTGWNITTPGVYWSCKNGDALCSTIPGYAPSVAADQYVPIGYGTPVIEVHQANNSCGRILDCNSPLYYSTTTVFPWNSPSYWPMFAPQEYDSAGGWNPSVSIFNNQVLEVHQVNNLFLGPTLWYRTGSWVTFCTQFCFQEFEWSSAQQYDSGMLPSVALTGDGVNTYAVEVHQATASCPSALMYRVGVITGATVQWSNSAQYGTGCNPSVGVIGGSVMEVHQASSTSGPLLSQSGTLSYY